MSYSEEKEHSLHLMEIARLHLGPTDEIREELRKVIAEIPDEHLRCAESRRGVRVLLMC
jgi:hypothetical protein